MLSIITNKELFSAIITGLTTSAIFLIILWQLRPRFEISNTICREMTELNGELIPLFYFKIINKSPFFKVYDVKIKAFICQEVNNLNGNDSQLSIVPFDFNSLSKVERFNFRHYGQNLFFGDKNIKTRSNYAAQFFTKVDAREELMQQGKSISFQVIAKHSLSGFTRVKTMTYNHALRVKDGRFLSGNTFKILQNQPVMAINTD